ncbi:MAG: PaaI family thioesterase [Velocimicrobium sp.]
MNELTFKNNGIFSDVIWDGIMHHIIENHLSDMDILDVKPGYAYVSLKINDSNKNLYGCIHGGTIFTLCDLTSGMAVYAYGVSNVTLQGTINYLQPGVSDVIYAEAKTDHKGNKTAVTRVEVTNAKKELLAIATFTMYITGTL